MRLLIPVAAAVLTFAGSSPLRAEQPSPVSAPVAAAPATETVTIYKSPTCACCGRWAEHMKENGFSVVSQDTNELPKLKQKLGVPAKMSSCHTAMIGGYVIEGHIPADVVKKLLAEKPAGVVGLAVPGMPTGSPGMEGFFEQSYKVYAFDKDGTTTVYAER